MHVSLKDDRVSESTIEEARGRKVQIGEQMSM